MPVTAQTVENNYVGNNSTTIFAYTFYLLREEQLTVALDGVVQVSGFTVSGVGNPSGGNVTFSVAPGSGVAVRLFRDSDVIRDTDYIEGGSLGAETLDDDQDYQTMILQELDQMTMQTNAAGNWDALNKKIVNLADATDPTDAMNQQASDARYVNTAGDTMTGTLDMGNQALTNPLDPVDDTGVGDRGFNDARYVNTAGDTMTGALDMGNQALTNPLDPVDGTGVGDRAFNDLRYINVSGDTMAGTLDMDGNSLTMGAGLLDTEGGTIQTGTGLIDTEGGDVELGGGQVLLENGSLLSGSSGYVQSASFRSNSAGVAQSGEVRLGNAQSVRWRNAANSGDLIMQVASDDNLYYNGDIVVLRTATQTLTNKTLTNPTISAYMVVTEGQPNADTGNIRLDNAGTIRWRNFADSANLTLDVNVNSLEWQGDEVITSVAAQTLENKTINSPTIDNPTFTNTSLGDLNDVDLTGLLNSQFIRWNSTSGNWEPGNASVSNLDDVGDVTITGPVADNEFLAYDNGSGEWINQTSAEVDLYTATELDGGQLDNRYFRENEFITTSAGAADVGKPIVLDADGNIDATMINDADIDHGNLTGLADDDHTQYYNAARLDTYIDDFLHTLVGPWVAGTNDSSVISGTGLEGYKFIHQGFSGTFNDIAVNGTRFVAISSSGATYSDSLDGAGPWTNVAVSNFPTGGSANDWSAAITFGDDYFVVVGESSGPNQRIFRSQDGISWAEVTGHGITQRITDIAFSGSMFVLTCGNGQTYYSTDQGATWSAGQTVPGTSVGVYAIATDGTTWTAVGTSTTHNVWTSTDPSSVAWTQEGNYESGATMWCVGYGGGDRVVGGDSGALVVNTTTGDLGPSTWLSVIYDPYSGYWQLTNNLGYRGWSKVLSISGATNFEYTNSANEPVGTGAAHNGYGTIVWAGPSDLWLFRVTYSPEGGSASSGTMTDSIQTTDATSTVLTNVAIPTDEEKILEFKVHGHEDATNDHVWKKIILCAKNVSGTASIVGGVDAVTGYDAGASTWTIVAGVSSASVTITVTGEAAHTIDWRSTVEID